MSDSQEIQHVPQYCRQRDKVRGDRAFVRINGKKIPLGKYGSPESRERYAELIGKEKPSVSPPSEMTVSQAIVRYLEYAIEYYGEGSKEFTNYRYALKPVRRLAGNLPVKDFGPKLLKDVREAFIECDYSRKNINKMVGRICKMFRWLAEEEIIPGAVWQSLKAVSGLRKGRTKAKETGPIMPVADEVVDATLPHLPVVVGDMVRLQRLTGMRPNEVCIVRPCDIDRSGEVWIYRPESHKTEHHGKERPIAIGPRGQEILLRYLVRDAQTYCFRPCDSEEKRRAQAHADRKTPLSYGNVPGKNKVSSPQRVAGERYTTDSYRRAIHRASAKAGVGKWAPNQLRHSAATAIRKEFGLEAAQVVLGHSSAQVTQVYAERDLAKGLEVARQIG